jgi:hypothetical protein
MDNARVRFIGPFRISEFPGKPDKVWISCGTGEGGEFCRVEFVLACNAGELTGDIIGAVDRFFWENF